MKKGRPEPELHAAARSGDLNTVQSILSSNPLAVNTRDKHSRTPLHLAAWSGHTEVVSYLCKEKADVGAAAMDDMAAIHFAAQKGHLEVVRILLSSGVSVKAANRKGFTPLHYAVQGSDLELVKYLVKKGASLTAKTKAGKTPLDLASGEEIQRFLKECEQSAKEGISNEHDSTDKSNLTPENPIPEVTASEHDNQPEDEREKRKSEEDGPMEASSEPKKAKVMLNHLLNADDTQEDENV